jgi:hypothetical protein
VQGEVPPGGVGKELVKLLIVCIRGNTVVDSGIVEFLKKSRSWPWEL